MYRDQQADYQRVGAFILEVLLVRTIIFGMYLPVGVGAVICLLRKRQKTRASWLLLLATSLTLFCCVCQYIGVLLDFMSGLFNYNLNFNVDYDYYSVGRLLDWRPTEFAQVLLSLFGATPTIRISRLAEILYKFFDPIFIISDILVVWRASCFASSRKARMLSLSTIVAFCVLFLVRIIYGGLTVTVLEATDYYYIDKLLEFGEIACIVCTTLSLIANSVATGFMTYKAYQLGSFSWRIKTRTPALKALILICESGLLYLLVQVFAVLGAGTLANSIYVPIVFELHRLDVSYILAAFYPASLVLLIEYHLTLATSAHQLIAEPCGPPTVQVLPPTSPGSSISVLDGTTNTARTDVSPGTGLDFGDEGQIGRSPRQPNV